ncbi:hypothetical protein B0T25DRAFT_517383 [Lasiosphaeria hispida]|uniref:Uncharacterized protein n=1 Tax=Lasiosphaeria hispida TaxID=260671 RepID=A0AAJ0MGR3_9PEZI|nr:hypothetical protein B0T25DRAFT_517383 [Lasiosphaeria hispida]
MVNQLCLGKLTRRSRRGGMAGLAKIRYFTRYSWQAGDEVLLFEQLLQLIEDIEKAKAEQDLVQVKQTQNSLIEADRSILEAKKWRELSNYVMLFIIVTVFFVVDHRPSM